MAGICAASILTGCTSQAPSSPSVLMAAPPDTGAPASSSMAEEQEPVKPDEAIQLAMVAGNLSSAYAGGDTGAYTLANYEDGSSDIIYFDYTAKTISLLDNPETLEGGSSGRLADTWGGISPVFAGGQLFLFRLGGDEELVAARGKAGQAAVMRLEADGSGLASQVFPPSWTLQLQSAVLTDGNHLYFMVVEQEEQRACLLVQMNTTTLEYEALHRFDDGYDYSLEGSWEMGPVLQRATPLPPPNDPDFNEAWKNRTFTFFALGLNSGETRDIFTYAQGAAASAQGNTIYYWNTEDSSLRGINTNTGEESSLAAGFAPSNYVQALFTRSLLGGRLQIQFSTSRLVQYFTFDPATGEVAETPIAKLGDNVTIFAETPDAFLVQSGDRWVAKDKIPYGFVPGAEVSPTNSQWIAMPEYALIAKTDYWAGKPNFTVLEDLIF